ncbi:MAG: patatin-like phospholipase family protein [Lachnospiraceae bacterium]|nr:patatin-like phospholipase family protein [Lachnospiraceae bacterium]
MKEIQAISLCSGGGKGAFQVGVMKALDEQGILQKVGTFVGTSVGALNAFMYAIGDVELTEFVWKNLVSPSTMLKTIELQKRPCISRDSLLKIIDYVGIDRFRRVNADVYAYAYNTQIRKSVPFLLNDQPDDRLRDILLATSAIPMVYSPVTIDGVKYIDGGVTPEGDCPLSIVRDLGLKNVLLVPLDAGFNPAAVSTHNSLKTLDLNKEYPKLEIEIIKPSRYNGGMIGIVDFDRKHLAARIRQGYLDAKKCLEEKEYTVTGAEEADRQEAGGTGTVRDACRRSKKKNRLTPAGTVRSIKKLAGELIKNSSDFEDFIGLSQFKNINAKTPTLGGHVFYRNIFECDGWRIQRHLVFPLRMHIRILDDRDVRRAWTMNPAEVLKNLTFFKKIKR